MWCSEREMNSVLFPFGPQSIFLGEPGSAGIIEAKDDGIMTKECTLF